MNNEIQVFENAEFGSIRTIEIDGDVWFVGKDIADVLGYSRPDHAIKKHVDEEDKLMYQISRSFFADSSYMLSFSVLCSCVCSRLISPSVSSWHKQDNTLMHQSPGHIQRRTPYNF